MPWTVTDPVQERIDFIGAINAKRASFRSVCRLFGIAPKTGYKWWNQFKRDGAEGLLEQSRRPHGNSRAITPQMAARFIELRRRHPYWGPRKLVHVLRAKDPTLKIPAPSTVGELLKKRGFVEEFREKRRGRGSVPRTAPLRKANAPNVVWSMDFKGSAWVIERDAIRLR